MTRAILSGGATALLLVGAAYWTLGREADPPAVGPTPVTPEAAEGAAPGSLYGRVTTDDGAIYVGRLRWGGDEEAFWSDTFNGVKDENPWAVHTPLERLNEERRSARVFGIDLPWGEPPVDLGRPFMARFGDIARIEAIGGGVRGVIEDRTEFDPDVRVTLKSGTVFDLDRLSAGDFDDGVRVWDRQRGVVDLHAREIRVIEFLPTPSLSGAPDRLHGTVRARGGEFTGFLQWDRQASVGTDVLVGRTGDGDVGLPFDMLRSIAREPGGGVRVTRRDGREVVLSGTRAVGPENRGVYVDDSRYGRVLVSWSALERVDFSPGGSGPAYRDFRPGRPLAGRVTTRDGRSLAGRLVYDLDESETTETLDAPSGSVDYTIPFGRVASIVLDGERAAVTLHSGVGVDLERAGDLGEGNAGVLVFAVGHERPAYVPWADVERIDLDGEATKDSESDGGGSAGAGPVPSGSR